MAQRGTENNLKAMPEYFSKDDLAGVIAVLDEVKKDPTLAITNPIAVASGLKG